MINDVRINTFECIYSLSSILCTHALALSSLQLNVHIHEEDGRLCPDDEELILPSLQHHDENDHFHTSKYDTMVEMDKAGNYTHIYTHAHTRALSLSLSMTVLNLHLETLAFNYQLVLFFFFLPNHVSKSRTDVSYCYFVSE